jgi:hypothetical protein
MDVLIHFPIVHVHIPSIKTSKDLAALLLMAVQIVDLVVLMWVFFMKPSLLRRSMVLRIKPFSRCQSVMFLGLSKLNMDLSLVFFINIPIKALESLFTLSPSCVILAQLSTITLTFLVKKKRLETLDGYIIPFSICSGLPYMDMFPPTKEELDTYPHVFFIADLDITDDDLHHSDYHPGSLDVYGDRIPSQHDVHRRTVQPNQPDLDNISPKIGVVPHLRIQHT